MSSGWETGGRRAWWARAAFLGLLAAAAMTASRDKGTPGGASTSPGGAAEVSAEDRAAAERLRRDVEWLAGAGGRAWDRPEILGRLAAGIAERWEGAGYRVERQGIPGMSGDYVNIIAFPPGGAWQGGTVLLAAHYDAVVGTPGADDNASGVAVLLELSRRLAEAAPGRSPFALAALTLEEPPFFGTPRQGGWVLASALRKRGVALEGAVVLEMVGYYRRERGSQAYPFPLGLLGYPSRGDFVGVVGNGQSRGLMRRLAGSLEASGLPVETLAVPGKGRLLEPVRLSDHAAFWDVGYRGVMVTDTSFYRNPNYHGPGDLPETLDYAMMARLVSGLARFVGEGMPP